MTLNKFEVRDIELIKIIAEKGNRADALAAARRFINRAPGQNGRREARIRAVAAFLPEFEATARV